MINKPNLNADLNHSYLKIFMLMQINYVCYFMSSQIDKVSTQNEDLKENITC